MNNTKSQFVGAAGTYYVMSKLAYECVHASATFGNAPYVDILACSEKGDKQVAIQVKTADFARRTTGRGKAKKWSSLDWALSYKAASLNLENLFFAFVDLGGSWLGDWEEKPSCDHWQPTVFIISSQDLSSKICNGWQDGYWRLQINLEVLEPYKEKWDSIKIALGQSVEENVGSVGYDQSATL